jgi:hypothetical protein
LDGGFGLQLSGAAPMAADGYLRVRADLGVERHDNGIASYPTQGYIVDGPDGSVTIYLNRSDADFLSFRFGVSVGIPN